MKLMKRIFAVSCSLLCVLAIAAAQAETVQPVLARFSVNDMAVSYVYVNSSYDQTEQVFGIAPDVEYIAEEATAEQKEVWHYDGMTLTFSDDGTLIGAAVTSAAYPGPRGVQVGQTREDVINRFFQDSEIDDETVLYSSGYVELYGEQLPPCATVQYNDDGTFAIKYAAPSEPFSDAVLADTTNYIYESLALLTVNFDAEGTVTSYSWVLGPWAE